MGFVGVRAWAPELARILALSPHAGLALRHPCAQARTPPKPPLSGQPRTQSLPFGVGGSRVAEEGGARAGTVRGAGVVGGESGERGGSRGLWASCWTFGGREGEEDRGKVEGEWEEEWEVGGVRSAQGGSTGLWASWFTFGILLVLLLASFTGARVLPGEAGVDGGSSDGTGEAGGFGHLGDKADPGSIRDTSGREGNGVDAPAIRKPAKGDPKAERKAKAGKGAKAARPGEAARETLADPIGAGADSTGGVMPAEAGRPEAADADSVSPGAEASAVVPGVEAPMAVPAVESGRNPDWVKELLLQPEGEQEAEERDLAAERKGKKAQAPTLILLPMAVAKGTPRDGGRVEKAEAAIRLGFAHSRRFRLLTLEEAARLYKGPGGLPKDCFSRGCLEKAAARLHSRLFVAMQLSGNDSVTTIKLVLAETPQGNVRRAAREWGRPRGDGIMPFAVEAGLLLARPDRVQRDSAANAERLIDGSEFLTMPWEQIPWLNEKDTVDNRPGGAGPERASYWPAWDWRGPRDRSPKRTAIPALPCARTLPRDGAQSFLRGFFAAPTLGARYAAMGGAGIAHVDNGLALMMNPAGVAQADRENVVAAKRSLPDGTPSLSMAYAGPLYREWSQGLGVQFEGDRLANETTLQGALAYDLEGLGRVWQGIKAGVEVKMYLAQVGEGGAGEDRSTGRSFGLGVDLGLQAPLTDKLTAGFAVRDAVGFLRHTNTFTDRSYSETLPVEYRLGAAYRASPDMLLLLDGQKAMWADQADHLRLGAERNVWRFLAIRCGLHEIFGREAVRKMSVGFGLDTDGFTDRDLKMRISVNYGYEFGLNEDEPLGGGQQFSLEAGF